MFHVSLAVIASHLAPPQNTSIRPSPLIPRFCIKFELIYAVPCYASTVLSRFQAGPGRTIKRQHDFLLNLNWSTPNYAVPTRFCVNLVRWSRLRQHNSRKFVSNWSWTCHEAPARFWVDFERMRAMRQHDLWPISSWSSPDYAVPARFWVVFELIQDVA